MAEFTIKDEELTGLKDRVVVLTGCSSGLGLATTELLLKLGAKVVGGDLNDASIKNPNFTYIKTNVTSWSDLVALFKAAISKYGHIDHVYPNAGIATRLNFLESQRDENGDFKEPNHLVFDINLKSVVNTSYLAIQHLRDNPEGGSVTLIGSASSFQHFIVADYATAKHGVLGLMRGLVPVLETAKIPIRVNCIGPSWTESNIVNPDFLVAAGAKVQGPEVVARNVALLMADENRNGQFVYSAQGRYYEIEDLFVKVGKQIVGGIGDDQITRNLTAIITEARNQAEV